MAVRPVSGKGGCLSAGSAAEDAESLQLFLQRARKHAECYGGAFLAALRRGQRDEQQTLLEPFQNLSERQITALRGAGRFGKGKHEFASVVHR